MDADPSKAFPANLQGHVVQCTCVEDALAVIRADAVLHDRELGSPGELYRWASVLRRYGHDLLATALSNRAGRLRAAEILLNMAGFGIPKPIAGIQCPSD